MGGHAPLPTIDSLKAQAKRLRDGLAANGNEISHGRALELVARQYGFRDWNTLFASAGNRRSVADLRIGDTVKGRYLGQPFTGRLVGLQDLASSGRFRLTLKFDEPVDVVTFKSFSAFRQRVTATVYETGRSAETTSNGEPHIVIDL